MGEMLPEVTSRVSGMRLFKKKCLSLSCLLDSCWGEYLSKRTKRYEVCNLTTLVKMGASGKCGGKYGK